MNPEYLLEASEEFAKIIWPIRNRLKIIDLILYGSVAKKSSNPHDVDLLIIHNNHLVDDFNKKLLAKKFLDINEEIKALKEISDIDFLDMFKNSKTGHLISKNLFHTSYMNSLYFKNKDYKEKWNKQNKDPHFARNILRDGFVWNNTTKKYDIPALSKYKIKEKSKITKPQSF